MIYKMTINTAFIRSIRCYKGANNPKYIVIHETDNWNNGAHALSHAKAHYNGNLDTSVHYYVDDGLQGHDAVYQTLVHEDGAFAVGKTYGSSNNPDANNRNTINIEICVNPETNYNIAVGKCIELVQLLMEKTGIDADHVIRHFDAKRKYCPRRMLDNPNIWQDFKEAIKNPEHSEEIVSKYIEDLHAWQFYRVISIDGVVKSQEALTDQWVVYKNKWFYVDENGIMATGLKKIYDKYFYLNESMDDVSTYGALMVTPDSKYGSLEVCYVN